MTERMLHHWLSLGVIGAAAVVFVFLFYVSAPYGRHTRPGWGFTLPARAGWMLMESPALAGFGAFFLMGEHALEPAPMALAGLWLLHYAHRTVIWPQRMKGKEKPMPASIVGMAMAFNLVNAYINARWLSEFGSYPSSWLTDPRFASGVLLFIAGMALNVQSDGVLFALRRPGEIGYKIPHGGGYRLVSSPNYLGELIEWGGFALACWSLPAAAFFIFTFANLVPRAVSHHRWYKQTFPDYPSERRAVIPWLL
jgi:protein-S-isoprenylcysteine O-methyltransferase Ste14